MRIRTSALDKISVDQVDSFDFVRFGHDRFNAAETTKHTRFDGDARSEQRDALQASRAHRLLHFGQHVDQWQRRYGGELRCADVGCSGHNGSEFSAARCHDRDQASKIVCETVEILCGYRGIDALNVSVGDQQARYAAMSLMRSDQLSIIVDSRAGSEAADQAKAASCFACITHDRGTLPT
ncbi:MAG: hypothetical protein WBW99_10945 [Pseudolabrys sp.]